MVASAVYAHFEEAQPALEGMPGMKLLYIMHLLSQEDGNENRRLIHAGYTMRGYDNDK